MADVERALVLIKPDGVRRGLIGAVISRIEAKGYQIDDLRMLTATQEILDAHYGEHRGKDFFAPLVAFMGSGPVVALVASGERVCEGLRSLAGATDPTQAVPGSIRGDFGRTWDTPVMENIVHVSDSAESAQREISLWF